MSQPARLGVFLCQGGRRPSGSPELRRLRWAAEAGARGGRVFEITHACQAEGAGAVGRLAAEHGLEAVLVAACPLATAGGPLGQSLVAAGVDPEQVAGVDLCGLPEAGLGRCEVKPGAERALALALAGLEGRRPAETAEVEVSPGVLVVGAGLAALAAARDLAAAGHPVSLVTPGKRLAEPEPLWGPEAAAEAAELAGELEGREKVELWRRGELVSLLGTAGRFQAVLRDAEGRVHQRPVGAVLVTQGPPRAPNAGQWLPAAKGVVSLDELAALAGAPAHLAKLAGRKEPRVAILVGLEREAGPAELRAALATAARLAGEQRARPLLLTRHAKVAAPDLEELSQRVRALGVPLFKLTRGAPRVEVGDEGLELSFPEEILGRTWRQELELLAVDQRPAPDEAWRGLARGLGLAPEADGLLQPAGVNALPTLSGRGGVFVAGAARGSRDLWTARQEVAHSLAAIRRLLGSGRVEAPAGRLEVDRRACALCLTCVRVCPHQAMGRVERRPVPNPLACTGCGTCAAECPMDAIQLVNHEDRRYRRQIKAGVSPLETHLAAEPGGEILVVACAQGAGPALAAARGRGEAGGQGLRFMQVPCAGKVDPEMVLAAFGEGFDLVLLAACHPQACYSLTGNLWAGLRVEHLRGLLAEAGFEPRRLFTGALAPAMAAEAAGLLRRAQELARELGPNPLKAAARERDFLAGFEVRVDEAYTIVA